MASEICRPQAQTVATKDLELTLDLDEGNKAPTGDDAPAPSNESTEQGTTPEAEAVEETPNTASADATTTAAESEPEAAAPDATPGGTFPQSGNFPQSGPKFRSVAAPGAPAAATTSTKVVNKPKLSEIVRPGLVYIHRF